MFKFIHHLLNPHCEHCSAEKKEQLELQRLARLEVKEEVRENSICASCETLQRQLEIANHEKAQLLARLLEKPEVPTTQEPPRTVTPPRTVPWAVRRQMLESEDRKKAELLRNAPKPQPVAVTKDDPEVAELERELDVAAEQREGAANV